MIRIFFIIVFFISLCFYPLYSYGQISLPWSCNFDSCPDWTQGQPLTCCNGLENNAGWTCNGQGEEINSTKSWGGSGKSQVHYSGQGTNVNSGGLRIRFVPEREIYFRYYIAYEEGYQTDGYYDKHLYINQRSNVGPSIVCELRYYDRYGCIGAQMSAPDAYKVGWKSKFSDYQWHWVEVHLRFGSSDGIYELWIDGVKVINLHNIAVGTDTDRFDTILIGSNQRNITHSGCKARYFDNLEITTAGPIGPVYGGIPPLPSPPIISNREIAIGIK